MAYTNQQREHIERSFNAFCKTVLYYEAVNAYRAIARRHQHEVSLDYLCELHFEPGDVDGRFVVHNKQTAFAFRGETVVIENERLAAALLNLSDKWREVLFLHFFFGYKDAEVAKLCGCCRATANHRKHKALRQLRKGMEVSQNDE